jgi:hypothetical protein
MLELSMTMQVAAEVEHDDVDLSLRLPAQHRQAAPGEVT